MPSRHEIKIALRIVAKHDSLHVFADDCSVTKPSLEPGTKVIDRKWHENGPPSGPFSLFNSDLRSIDYVHHPNRGDPDLAERR